MRLARVSGDAQLEVCGVLSNEDSVRIQTEIVSFLLELNRKYIHRHVRLDFVT